MRDKSVCKNMNEDALLYQCRKSILKFLPHGRNLRMSDETKKFFGNSQKRFSNISPRGSAPVQTLFRRWAGF